MEMHSYLTKKIAIPGSKKLHCLEWCSEEGWMVVGGDNGLLKIIKENEGGKAKASAIRDQTLRGHNGRVLRLAWNHPYRKLATADEHGLIIVWKLEQNQFVEEMINSSDHGLVGDLKWSRDGKQICIVYGDGAIVVGSVGGSRLWAKASDASLKLIEWSPDNNYILIMSTDDTMSVYESSGNFLTNMSRDGASDIVDFQWFHGHSSDRRNFAVVYSCGDVQLSNGLQINTTLSIDCGITIESCAWNECGNILAVCGELNEEEDPFKPSSAYIVKFYNHRGEFLNCLPVSNSDCIFNLAWDVSGSRILVACESSIFFANVHPPAKGCILRGTHIYSSTEDSSNGEDIVFFNPASGRRCTQQVGDIVCFHRNAYICLVIVRASAEVHSVERSGKYGLMLFDDAGATLASKTSLLQPLFAALSETCIVIADHRYVYVWSIEHYASSLEQEDWSQSLQNKGIENMFDSSNDSQYPAKKTHQVAMNGTTEARIISAIECSSTTLFVGREDGFVDLLSLPNLCRTKRFRISCLPKVISANKDATTLICIDAKRRFSVYETVNDESKTVKDLNLIHEEDSRMWKVQWAMDDNDTFAYLDKGQLFVYERAVSKKYKVGSIREGNLIEFSNNEIKVISIHEGKLPYLIQAFETRILKETKADLRDATLSDLNTFFSSHQSPTALKLIANSAMKRLDVKLAKRAFARLKDYESMLFIEKIQADSSESHCFHQVTKFLSEGHEEATNGTNNPLTADAIIRNIDSGDFRRVVLDLFEVSDSIILTDLLMEINVNRGKLEKMGELLILLSFQELAILCYQNIDHTLAIKKCVEIHRWRDAVDLARSTEERREIQMKARAQCKLLAQDKKVVETGIIYHQAQMHTDAASVWSGRAVENQEHSHLDLNTTKLLYCLAGHEMTIHRNSAMYLPKSQGTKQSASLSTAEALDILIHDSIINGSRKLSAKDVHQAWRGATANHFLILAHRQLYDNDPERAMTTAIKCTDFTDYLCAKTVYSLLAISSFQSNYLGICSKALIYLKSIIDDCEILSKLEDISLKIFQDRSPIDKKELPSVYYQSLNKSKQYFACIISGRSISNERTVQCKACLNFMIENELKERVSCPLCHESCKNLAATAIT